MTADDNFTALVVILWVTLLKEYFLAVLIGALGGTRYISHIWSLLRKVKMKCLVKSLNQKYVFQQTILCDLYGRWVYLLTLKKIIGNLLFKTNIFKKSKSIFIQYEPIQKQIYFSI